MVLNNLKYFCKGVCLNGNPKVANAPQKNTSGKTASADSKIQNCEIDGTLHIGTGTTPVTADDYCLESEVTDITQVSSNEVTNIVGDKVAKTFVRTITYTGSEEITITEIGIIKQVAWSTSSMSSTESWLLARKILETPIVVAPNETFTVSMTIEM